MNRAQEESETESLVEFLNDIDWETRTEDLEEVDTSEIPLLDPLPYTQRGLGLTEPSQSGASMNTDQLSTVMTRPTIVHDTQVAAAAVIHDSASFRNIGDIIRKRAQEINTSPLKNEDSTVGRMLCTIPQVSFGNSNKSESGRSSPGPAQLDDKQKGDRCLYVENALTLNQDVVVGKRFRPEELESRVEQKRHKASPRPNAVPPFAVPTDAELIPNDGVARLPPPSPSRDSRHYTSKIHYFQEGGDAAVAAAADDDDDRKPAAAPRRVTLQHSRAESPLPAASRSSNQTDSLGAVYDSKAAAAPNNAIACDTNVSYAAIRADLPHVVAAPDAAAQASPVSTSLAVATVAPKKKKKKKAIFSSSSTAPIHIVAEDITERDVLCGREFTGSDHQGNVLYLQMIENNKARHHAFGNQHGEKTCIRNNIVQEVVNQGGRFVRKTNEGEHHLLTLEEARKKVGQALRENKNRKKAKKKKKPS